MSIKQDIKDNLKTSLEAILVNSGYNTTVKQVSLSPLKDDQEQPWIWIAEGSEAVKVEDDTNIRMELMLKKSHLCRESRQLCPVMFLRRAGGYRCQ